MNRQINFDIIIVGGGPAGLSSAIKASEQGCKVALFEKSKEIGYPIHTSGASWIDELEKLGVPSKFMHPIKFGEFIGTKNRAKFVYDKASGCVLDIRGLYQYLAEKAAIAGTEISINSKVISPIIIENYIEGVKVLINGKEHNFKSNIVIDASGFNAIISKKVGLLEKFKIYGVGAEYDLVSTNWDQNKVVFIMNKNIPVGYGWVFPYGNSRVRVGIGIIRPFTKESPIKCLKHFLSSDDEIVKNLKPFSKIEFHQGVVPNNGVLPKTVSNGLITVGDAAGQVSGIAGEGIRYALDIGNIAGSVAANAIKKERFDERFLSRYEKKWRTKYELKFKIMHEINKRLRTYDFKDWDERIKKLSLLSPQLLVDYLKGNFSVKYLLKIFKDQPRLFSSTIFKMVKNIIKNG